MIPKIEDMVEAIRLMSAGLGRAELEIATSYTAPLYWIVKSATGRLKVGSGSAFFLHAGDCVFGVTAQHVIEGWRVAVARGGVAAPQLGRDLRLDFGGRNAIIAEDREIDIATFRIT